jgi:hypothetical protein
MKTRGRMVLWLAIVGLTALPVLVGAQSLTNSANSPSSAVLSSPVTTRQQLSVTYSRPTEKMRLRNYFFDAFGPYPIVGAALAGGINQADHTPREWKQGAAGYSKRFGSDFGIAATTTTMRYAVARAFGEDTLYYRCECKGVFSRLRHAVISTFTSRRGDDGHRFFSFPALVAPYAGTMTAVYGWFSGRYGAKDAFRMGNYSVLGYAGGNVALEFLYRGPHSFVSRIHLNNRHGAPDSGSTL